MTLLLVVLLVTALLLWPRGRSYERSRRAGSRTPFALLGTNGGEPSSSGSSRLRGLLAREVRFGRRRRGWVADFAELSAVGLDAGLPAAEAARLACDVGGSAATRTEFATLGHQVSAAQEQGGSIGECLARAAEGDRDLAFLAAAWQLTDEFGVAAAPAARASAAVLRERTESEDRRTVLAAGPRASMWLLTLLPLSGPLVALVLGLPVGDVYGSSASLVAAVGGLVLTGLGWLWSRTVLRRALRSAEIS
ncbi:type II secretion system F family protein [Knoellia sp. CPCC 206453]|uniref:type II secretion system F family protein n=1 Tax=Knoellia pratensis TaxID=3404796 RepID=UPI00361A992C